MTWRSTSLATTRRSTHQELYCQSSSWNRTPAGMPVPSPSTMPSGMAPSRTRLTSRVLSELATTRFEMRRGGTAPDAVPATRRRPSATGRIPVGKRRLDIAEHYIPTLQRISVAGATASGPVGPRSALSVGSDAGAPPGRALPGRLEVDRGTAGHRVLPSSCGLHELPDHEVVQRVPGIARH